MLNFSYTAWDYLGTWLGLSLQEESASLLPLIKPVPKAVLQFRVAAQLPEGREKVEMISMRKLSPEMTDTLFSQSLDWVLSVVRTFGTTRGVD